MADESAGDGSKKDYSNFNLKNIGTCYEYHVTQAGRTNETRGHNDPWKFCL